MADPQSHPDHLPLATAEYEITPELANPHYHDMIGDTIRRLTLTAEQQAAQTSESLLQVVSRRVGRAGTVMSEATRDDLELVLTGLYTLEGDGGRDSIGSFLAHYYRLEHPARAAATVVTDACQRQGRTVEELAAEHVDALVRLAYPLQRLTTLNP